MTDHVFKVLFLCTGNSARSILAEAILNDRGAGRFRAYSAGSHPVGRVHPLAIECLQQRGLPIAGLHSKGWETFDSENTGPNFDFVFTVCDRAAGEVCPIWPGHPVTAHWGIEDPAAVAGTDDEKCHAFAETFAELQRRIARFVALPLADLQGAALARELDAIGRRQGNTR